MSNTNTPPNKISGVYTRSGQVFPSPQHLFTVESQVSRSDTQAMARFATPLGSEYSSTGHGEATTPPTGVLPLADNSSQARQYGVSVARSQSPQWAESGNSTSGSDRGTPVLSGRVQNLSHGQSLPRPQPRNPDAPSATEDPNFFLRRVQLPSPVRAPTEESPSLGSYYWTPPPISETIRSDSLPSVVPPTQHQVPHSNLPNLSAGEGTRPYISYSASGTWQAPIMISSQPSVGHPERPILITDPTPPPPPPVPAKRAPRKRASAKGKGKANEPANGANDNHESTSKKAPKRPRITKATEPDCDVIASAAAIAPIAQPLPPPFRPRKNSPWSNVEDQMAALSWFFAVERYDFCKENQTTAHREAKQVFKNRISPQQIANLISRFITRYKIYEDVTNQTGMGMTSDEAIKQYLDSQGIDMSPQVLRNFGNSEAYSIMDQVLKKDPTVLKQYVFDPSRPLSPFEHEEHSGYASSGDEEQSADEYEILTAPAIHQSIRPKPHISPRVRADGVIDVDPSSDSTTALQKAPKKRGASARKRPADDSDGAFLEMSKSMSAMQGIMLETQKAQGDLFSAQKALNEQKTIASKAEAHAHQLNHDRSTARLYLDYYNGEVSRRTSVYTNIHAERAAQLEEVKKMAEFEKAGFNDEHTREMVQRIRAGHNAVRIDSLILQSAESLRQIPELQLPAKFRYLFEDAADTSSTDRPPASSPSPSIAVHTPNLPTPEPAPINAGPISPSQDPKYGQGEAGPGPRTQAIMRAMAGV
ncbi:hypothetical protein RhiLY_12271 [Ceratobasidium sp. AG-Ba]|nr:hypothetical protein RhiLY_12271 [Ceratobasidium sp. AG-Ba]